MAQKSPDINLTEMLWWDLKGAVHKEKCTKLNELKL